MNKVEELTGIILGKFRDYNLDENEINEVLFNVIQSKVSERTNTVNELQIREQMILISQDDLRDKLNPKVLMLE